MGVVGEWKLYHGCLKEEGVEEDEEECNEEEEEDDDDDDEGGGGGEEEIHCTQLLSKVAQRRVRVSSRERVATQLVIRCC